MAMIALLLAGLFVCLTSFVIPLVVGNVYYFNAGVYKEALVKTRAYETLVSEVASAAAESDNVKAQGIDAATIQRIMSAILPADWMQGQTENVLDQLFTYIASGEGHLKLNVSMQAVKDNLRGAGGDRVIDAYFATLPVCTSDQLLGWGQVALTGDLKGAPECRPSDDILTQMKPTIKTSLLAEMTDSIHDQVDLVADTQMDITDFEKALPQIRLGRLLASISPFISLGLLILITLLVVRSPGAFFRWWGIPLLISGVLAALLALLGMGLSASFVEAIRSSATGSGVGIVLLIASVIEEVLRGGMIWTGIVGGVIGLGGLGMTVLGFILRGLEKSETPPITV
jgi:hypothetical protein